MSINSGGHLIITATRLGISTIDEKAGLFARDKGGYIGLIHCERIAEVTKEDEEGATSTVQEHVSKLPKNRWVKLTMPFLIKPNVSRVLVHISPTEELVKAGMVKGGGIFDPKHDAPHIYFRADSQMDLDDLDFHVKIIVMEPAE